MFEKKNRLVDQVQFLNENIYLWCNRIIVHNIHIHIKIYFLKTQYMFWQVNSTYLINVTYFFQGYTDFMGGY